MIAAQRKGAKSKRGCDWVPSSCQKVVVLILAAANLLVCFATFSYLQQFWEDAPHSHPEAQEFSHIDFSKLYDVPPGHAAQDPTRAMEATEDAAHKPTRSDSPVDASDSLEVQALNTVDSARDGAVPSRPKMCPICGNKVVGPLPTSLKGQAQSCDWKESPNAFLSGTVGITGPTRLEEAKEMCVQFGPACGGVTCARPAQGVNEASACSCRASKDPRVSPTKEVSYIKDCKFEVNNCEEEIAKMASHSPFAKDLHGTPIVILAHNREAELRSCLGSLLAMPEVALFRLHVSLDDPAAFTMMEGCVKREAAAHKKHIDIWKATAQVADPAQHNQETLKWFQTNTGKIAHHYWQVFERAFMEEMFERVIFVEEDLLFSPDFLALFRSTAGLLDKDPSLWCISAWNDFGFKGTAVDPCRLHRTTYFPGLGFLLTRKAWLQIRQDWPTAPTMGWDYWMRVEFRTADRECIIPEVSRSHHAAAKGSSVSSAKQLRLFEAMAFADTPSTCDAVEPCSHFGNVSYLLSEEYESWMRSTVERAPRIDSSELRARPGVKTLPRMLHVVPFQRELFNGIAEASGLMPRNTKGSIPADLRSDHYGAMAGKLMSQGLPLLLVDRRSSRGYLQKTEQLRFGPDFEVIAGSKGLSCDEVCQRRGSTCDKMQLYFLNDCNLLRKHFECEAGCAHQVGKELPVYVPDEFQPTYRQCLLTFISPMSCDAKHASTSRLCACKIMTTILPSGDPNTGIAGTAGTAGIAISDNSGQRVTRPDPHLQKGARKR